MEIQYLYTKLRRHFGRPYHFQERPAESLADIYPDSSLVEEYVVETPINAAIQCTPIMSEHQVNSERVTTEIRGMNHAEGGWPKDINATELEQTQRYRKKVEKDDNYTQTVLNLAQTVEHCIMQNNSIDIYGEYFDDIGIEESEKPPAARSLNVFRDPSAVKRTATSISWNPESAQRIAVSYASIAFQEEIEGDEGLDSHVWDIETPQKPELSIRSKSQIMSLAYNPKDSHVILGGCVNGQVGFWDDRRGSAPVEITPSDVAHRDPVYSTIWLHSKSGTECFTSATDGVVLWWDTRKLSEPVESLILDVTKKATEMRLDRAHGATCMEYEPTMATKFMVGTEQGTIIIGNRKGKTPQEKMAAVYPGHLGPVYALERNPLSLKNFLTVGDWTARIWAEEVKESCIMWTKESTHALLSGCWSPVRHSVFFVTTAVGSVEAWDILVKQKDPILTIQVVDDPLYSICVHEHGKIMAVGSVEGSTTLVELSDTLCSIQKNERALLTAMFEREVRREKTLEGRMRELRFKKAGVVVGEPEEVAPEETEQQQEESAKQDFLKELQSFRTMLKRKKKGKLPSKPDVEKVEEVQGKEGEEEEPAAEEPAAEEPAAEEPAAEIDAGQ